MDFLQTFFGHDIDFDKAVTMFSIHHLIYVLSGIVSITFILKYAKRIRAWKHEQLLKKIMIGVLIVFEITYHVHNWTYPRFSIPLHICSFAVFMSMYVLKTDSKKVFEYLFFFGTLGGIMALTFPVSWGYTYLNFRYYHFLLLHNMLIMIALYYYKAYDYRLTYHSVIKVYRTVLIMAILVHIANLFFINMGFESNYWFISFVPSVVDSFFTSYPAYIVTFLAAVFLTMNILFFATHKDQLPFKEKKSLS